MSEWWSPALLAALEAARDLPLEERERERAIWEKAKPVADALSESGPLHDSPGLMLRSQNGASGLGSLLSSVLLVRQISKGLKPRQALEWFDRVLATESATGSLIAVFRGALFSAPLDLGAGVEAFSGDQWTGDFQLPKWGYFGPEPVRTVLKTRLTISPVIVSPDWKAPTPDIQLGPYYVLREFQLVLALVANHHVYFDGSWFEYDSDDLRRATFGVTRSIPSVGFDDSWTEPALLDSDETRRAISNYLRLTGKAKDKIRLALDRFNSALAHPAFGDQALDLAISIESLLLDGAPGDNTFKLALRSALLLGGTLEERKETRSTIKRLYKIRSAIVHNGRHPQGDDVDAVVKSASICRRILLRIMELGPPDDWNEFELGQAF